jgi:DNA-binding XRE family transcriptional regulator
MIDNQSPSTRSYIKIFGRTSHRLRHTQSMSIRRLDHSQIGVVEAVWSEDHDDWRFVGAILMDGQSYSTTHETWDQAKRFVELKHFEIYRHQSFGAWVEYFLNETNMSKVRLAHHLDVSRQSIHAWINGDALPSVQVFIKLGELAVGWLDCPLNMVLLDMAESIQ